MAYPVRDGVFWELLSCALITEMIFNLLRKVRLRECLLPDYFVLLILDKLEVIIKWLQVSVNSTDKSLKLKI